MGYLWVGGGYQWEEGGHKEKWMIVNMVDVVFIHIWNRKMKPVEIVLQVTRGKGKRKNNGGGKF
jgi:hypothetical protein